MRMHGISLEIYAKKNVFLLGGLFYSCFLGIGNFHQMFIIFRNSERKFRNSEKNSIS